MEKIDNSFMQSTQWEELQKAVGRKVWRVEQALVVKYNLPLGRSYLCCFRPHLNQDNLTKLISGCEKIAKAENSLFLHLEPQTKLTANQFNNLTVKRSNCMQPKQSLILDISPSESDILAQMHQKTRYNIRLADKKNVLTRTSVKDKDVDIFWRLAADTAGRSDFHFHSQEYYRQMMEVLGRKYGILELVIAEHESEPLAALMILYYGQQAIYLHGASSNKARNLMGPQAAQWKAIKEAKQRGCLEYDFWGVAPLEEITNAKCKISNKNVILKSETKSSDIGNQSSRSPISNSIRVEDDKNGNIKDYKLKIKNSSHPWAGITKFKLGFAPSGKYVQYPDAVDIVYNLPWYNSYQAYKRFRGR